MPSGVDRHNYDPLDAVKKSIDSLTGKFAYVDYIVKLPPRSLQEFSWWVCRHMENAEVLEPDFLRQQHYQAALALVARYGSIPALKLAESDIAAIKERPFSIDEL